MKTKTMKNKEANKLIKRAEKLRNDFRKDYNNIAKKFNELSLDIDNFLTNIIEENKEEENDEELLPETKMY